MKKTGKTWQQLWVEHLVMNARPLTVKHWGVLDPMMIGII